jgi:WD40 repeat protein
MESKYEGKGGDGPLSGEDAMELEHVIGYTGHFVQTLFYHPTQAKTIVYGMGATVVIADLTDPHKQDFLRGHDNEISAVAISADGGLVASGQKGSTLHKGFDSPVIVWDFEERRDVYQLLGLSHSVENLCFSSDARFLAASGGDKNILMVWDMQTGEVVVCKGNLKPISSITWGPVDTSGRRPAYSLITACNAQVYRNMLEYKIETMAYGMTSERFQLPASGLVRDYNTAVVRYDPQSQTTTYIAGTAVSDMCVFNVDQCLYRASVGVSTGGIYSSVSSSEYILLGSGDGTVKKLRGFDQRWTLEGECQLEGAVVSLSLSPDEVDILAGTNAGKMYRVLIADMTFVEVAASHITPVAAVDFGKRSDIFSTLSKGGRLNVRDLSDYALVGSTLIQNRGEGKCLLFRDNGDLLTGWDSGAIECHSGTDVSKKWDIAQAHNGAVCSLAEAPGKYIVTGGEDKCVRIWTTDSGIELICQFAEHRGAVTGVLVDLQQPHILHSCGLGRALLSYDLKKERRITIHQMSGNSDGAFLSLAQRRDSELELVTAGSDGRILFWDADEDAPVQNILDPNRMRLNCISMSPSGRFVAVCGEDHQTKIYDIQTESLVAVGIGHSSNVTGIVWSPDERQCVSVGDDCCVCVWNFYGTQ